MDFSIQQIFTVIGILLIIAEITAPGFVLLPMGVGFLITAGVAPVIPSLPLQLVVLAINMGLVLLFFSKVIKPKLAKQKFATNADSLVGQESRVTEEINNEKGTGYIKIYSDQWRAISIDNSTLTVGTRVRVERLDGNKVFVSRI